jgi:hypothetical protein
MKSALRITSSSLGIYAGLLGIEHGFFEILQGNIAPGGLMINAIGVPCQPDAVWHACYPALTLIPNLLATGILAVVAGLSVLTWAAAFVQGKQGGLILLLLSILMLVVGGGFVSTFIGVIAGVAGSRINAPLTWGWSRSVNGLRFLTKLWPWTLTLLAVWIPGSWIMGYFFSGAMLATGFLLFLFFDIGLPLLTVFSGLVTTSNLPT